MHMDDQVRPDQFATDSEQEVQAVASQPPPLAYASAGQAQAAAAAGAPVRLLPWAGVAPTPEHVRDGSYPLTRPLNLLTRDPPHGPARDFIDFARSAEVHDVIQKHHLVPA